MAWAISWSTVSLDLGASSGETVADRQIDAPLGIPADAGAGSGEIEPERPTGRQRSAGLERGQEAVTENLDFVQSAFGCGCRVDGQYGRVGDSPLDAILVHSVRTAGTDGSNGGTMLTAAHSGKPDYAAGRAGGARKIRGDGDVGALTHGVEGGSSNYRRSGETCDGIGRTFEKCSCANFPAVL